MAESVYKVIELVGTSTESWEKAAAAAVQKAGQNLRNLRTRELDNQSFAGIGQAMGAEGITVDRLEDVGPALEAAVDRQMNDGVTTVVEIMCTQELGDPFRRDALSTPVRYLDKYKNYV